MDTNNMEVDSIDVDSMDVSEYIGFVAAEGETFAAAAAGGALDVPIAPCPGWDMRELVRHLGLIHLWAAGNVAYPKNDWLVVNDLPDLSDHWPELASWPDDTELIAWYRATLANLVDVLESAPADVACFTFLPAPTPLTMWARRQASEIAIHRFDAESARGLESTFAPSFAADMLDELLSGFAPRHREIDVDRRSVLHVDAEDVDSHWWLTFGPEGIRTSCERPVGTDPDLTVSGTAAELYLMMWNRTPDATVRMQGNTAVIDLWHRTCRVRWS